MKNKELLNKYLPRYSFNEYHDIVIECSREEAYKAVKNLDFSKSGVIKFLFKLRRLPVKEMTLMGLIDNMNFTVLEDVENEELLVGFQATTSVEKIENKDKFINDESHRLKAVWNFYIEEIGENRVRVSTETRVLCIALVTKIFFRIYWFFIRPFSGLIRMSMLKIIKKECMITQQ